MGSVYRDKTTHAFWVYFFRGTFFLSSQIFPIVKLLDYFFALVLKVLKPYKGAKQSKKSYLVFLQVQEETFFFGIKM